ncbi:MAG TPA: cell division protein FtsZ [Candidatus Marinimicrobia bacterium]|nr:cell division protein FtsZ [Candidatus Neomarinimicrobiota bacterium]
MVIYDDFDDSRAKIKVVGVGGAGGNAVNRMIESNLTGVEFIAVNTDAQALNRCLAQVKIQIGREVTRGLGAGARPDIGRKAAEESKDAILQAIEGADMVFITAGMGGGTGTGAAPLVADLAKSSGALTVGIVTKPFSFEARARSKNAELGIAELRRYVDTLIVIQNEKLYEIVGDDVTIVEAFHQADTILNQATSGISNIINSTGLVNVDFADVKTIMENMGDAIMGIGTASGPQRAVMAASLAINSPILDDVSISGAKGVLINFTGTNNIKLSELREAAEVVHQAAGDEANIIFGTVINEEMGDEIQITVIATGFNEESIQKRAEEQEIALPQQPQPSQISIANGINNSVYMAAPANGPAANSPRVASKDTTKTTSPYHGFTGFGKIAMDDRLEEPAYIRARQNMLMK